MNTKFEYYKTSIDEAFNEVKALKEEQNASIHDLK